jgi:hypothetical protein
MKVMLKDRVCILSLPKCLAFTGDGAKLSGLTLAKVPILLNIICFSCNFDTIIFRYTEERPVDM